MSILQTIDLKKYYGTEPNITRALDGVNFSVELLHFTRPEKKFESLDALREQLERDIAYGKEFLR